MPIKITKKALQKKGVSYLGNCGFFPCRKLMRTSGHFPLPDPTSFNLLVACALLLLSESGILTCLTIVQNSWLNTLNHKFSQFATSAGISSSIALSHGLWADISEAEIMRAPPRRRPSFNKLMQCNRSLCSGRRPTLLFKSDNSDKVFLKGTHDS